jgi:hypothetical protein
VSPRCTWPSSSPAVKWGETAALVRFDGPRDGRVGPGLGVARRALRPDVGRVADGPRPREEAVGALTRHRDPPPEVFVFADGGYRRAESSLRGLRRPRHIPAGDDPPGRRGRPPSPRRPSPNLHVYSVCEASRELVCGEVVTAFRTGGGMAGCPCRRCRRSTWHPVERTV